MLSDLLNKEVLTALASAGIGWVLAWWAGVGKMKTELAYIKGQLSQLIKIHGDLSQVKENQAIITRDQTKLRKDVDAAHSAIRVLNTKG